MYKTHDACGSVRVAEGTRFVTDEMRDCFFYSPFFFFDNHANVTAVGGLTGEMGYAIFHPSYF